LKGKKDPIKKRKRKKVENTRGGKENTRRSARRGGGKEARRPQEKKTRKEGRSGLHGIESEYCSSMDISSKKKDGSNPRTACAAAILELGEKGNSKK